MSSSLDGHSGATPNSSIWAKEAHNKYLLEHDRWFGGGRDAMRALLDQALECQLGGWRLRSLAWRLFLQVLPADKSNWTLVTREHRRVYQLAKNTYSDYTAINDPQIASSVNNPLSVDEQSPWHRLFEHREARRVICQDVVRTMPEVALFRDERVRTCMVDVLFVFTQKHPEVEYVQGMHELLAPIIYLLMKEYHNFDDVRANCRQQHPTMELLAVLFDKKYVEHDAFYILEKILLMMDWSGSVNRHRHYMADRKLFPDQHTPFSKERWSSGAALSWEPSPCNRAVRQHLRLHDYNLYLKLVELGVEPQLYGLKMFRVLFGREFRLPELCCVWDALLADSYETSALDLVPYLFCAILIWHRTEILARDGMETLTFLMNMPAVSNISACVAFAVHLRAPQTQRRPDCVPGSPRKMPAGSVHLRRRKSADRTSQSSRENSPAAAGAARPRSMPQPPASAVSALPRVGGRANRAKKARNGADAGATDGDGREVSMEDVSALREKHAKLAAVETTAYAVVENRATQTPQHWNPGLAGAPSGLQRALDHQAECVARLDRMLCEAERDVDVALLREVVKTQRELLSEMRDYLVGWTAPPASPRLSQRGRPAKRLVRDRVTGHSHQQRTGGGVPRPADDAADPAHGDADRPARVAGHSHQQRTGGGVPRPADDAADPAHADADRPARAGCVSHVADQGTVLLDAGKPGLVVSDGTNDTCSHSNPSSDVRGQNSVTNAAPAAPAAAAGARRRGGPGWTLVTSATDAWPVEEVLPAPAGAAHAQLGLSPAYDTLAVDVASLALSEP